MLLIVAFQTCYLPRFSFFIANWYPIMVQKRKIFKAFDDITWSKWQTSGRECVYCVVNVFNWWLYVFFCFAFFVAFVLFILFFSFLKLHSYWITRPEPTTRTRTKADSPLEERKTEATEFLLAPISSSVLVLVREPEG